MRNNTYEAYCFSSISVICILLYGFYDIKGGFDYAFPRRMIRVGAMVVTGICNCLFNSRIPNDYT